jgi:virginiamycin B lyase
MKDGRVAYRAGMLVLALLVSGCGGGGHATTSTLPKSPASSSKNSIAYSIVVPAANGKTAKAVSRTPKFVSPATKSLAIAIAGTTTNVDLVSGAPGCASDYTHPSIIEIPVGSEPRGMTVGPDGNPWFVEDAGEGIGTIKAGNVFSDYSTGRTQESLIIGPDGYFWIADIFGSQIGHLKTDLSSYNEFGGLDSDVRQLAVAPDNTVWFTNEASGPSAVLYHIGSDGTYPLGDNVPLTAAGQDVVQGPDGAMYASEDSGSDGYLARVAKAGGVWTRTNEVHVPNGLRALIVGPDHALWTVDDTGVLYRFTTSMTFTTPARVSSGGFGVGMANGPDGAIWLTEYVNNLIARVTLTGAVTEFPVPSPQSSPYGIISGTSDGAVYFTERSTARVGKMQFPTACSGTIPVNTPAGPLSATVTAYDATGGGGNALSTQVVTTTIVPNAVNTLNFVLNGIVKTALIAPGNVDPQCSTSGAYPLVFQAFDASGNVIVGPGTYVDANGNPLTFTFATSDAPPRSTLINTTVTGPASAAPAIDFTGGLINNQTVTATASGGTFAGTIAPLTVGNDCPS